MERFREATNDGRMAQKVIHQNYKSRLRMVCATCRQRGFQEIFEKLLLNYQLSQINIDSHPTVIHLPSFIPLFIFFSNNLHTHRFIWISFRCNQKLHRPVTTRHSQRHHLNTRVYQ